MADGDGLENHCGGNVTVGSNPTPSADQLSVSVNTVTTHIRSIYARLQVSDRSSTVQRARELRLLAVAR